MVVVAIVGLALGVALTYGIYNENSSAFDSIRTVTSFDFPQHLSTVTKLLIAVNVLHISMIACNTTTFAAGTAYTTFSNSTEYLFPTPNSTFLNVTITTAISLSASTVTDRTVTTTACAVIP